MENLANLFADSGKNPADLHRFAKIENLGPRKQLVENTRRKTRPKADHRKCNRKQIVSAKYSANFATELFCRKFYATENVILCALILRINREKIHN